MFDQSQPPDTSMQVSATRLLSICRQLTPAYQRWVSIPVLETVRIIANPNGSTFQITDLDLTIRVQADDLTSNKPWDACVSFGLLRRIAATLDGVIRIAFAKTGPKDGPTDQMMLSTEDGLSATINLLCTPLDFPVLPDALDDAEAWHGLTLTPAQLRRHLDLARHCVSTQETRYYLNGIYLCRKPDGQTLRSVATDGHHMAVIDGTVDMPEGVTAILPTFAVRALCQLIKPTANDPVVLMLHKTTPRLRLVHGALQIDCKMIDAKYPDYTRVLPKVETRAAITMTATALRRLTPFFTERSQAVTLQDGKATVRSVDLGGEIAVPVQWNDRSAGDTPPLGSCGFNLRYLLDQGSVTPCFRMEVTSPGDPARIFGEDPDAMWIIMPMRV
jgi:DNA polymerase III subunit beta